MNTNLSRATKDAELYERFLRENISEAKLNPETYARIRTRVLSKAQQHEDFGRKENRLSGRKALRVCTVALVAVLTLGIALAGSGVGERILSMFAPQAWKMGSVDVLPQMSPMPQITSTDNDITIKLEGIYSDAGGTVLLFEIEDKQNRLCDNISFKETWNQGILYSNSVRTTVEDPETGKFYQLYDIADPQQILGKDVKLEITRVSSVKSPLDRYAENLEEMILVWEREGKWVPFPHISEYAVRDIRQEQGALVISTYCTGQYTTYLGHVSGDELKTIYAEGEIEPKTGVRHEKFKLPANFDASQYYLEVQRVTEYINIPGNWALEFSVPESPEAIAEYRIEKKIEVPGGDTYWLESYSLFDYAITIHYTRMEGSNHMPLYFQLFDEKGEQIESKFRAGYELYSDYKNPEKLRSGMSFDGKDGKRTPQKIRVYAYKDEAMVYLDTIELK